MIVIAVIIIIITTIMLYTPFTMVPRPALVPKQLQCSQSGPLLAGALPLRPEI